MSKAMQALKDFLTVSPSVVFPDEVLKLLEPVEREIDELKAENAKLRESLGEGAGTCKAVYSPNGVYCSVCHGGGLTIPRRGVNALRNFCPNCGRKVVDE